VKLKLFYFHDPKGNFGDDMNEWIWDELLPGWQSWSSETHLLGIGTILNTDLGLPGGMKLVVGSGTGYGQLPTIGSPGEWDVRAVRGPLSAERLGLEPHLGIADPAMMLPTLDMFKNLTTTGSKPIFVPHCSNEQRHNWEKVCSRIGIKYISPRLDSKYVISQIATAPLVIAESMHAAIVADAFRTPWIAVSVSGMLNYPKWEDWAASINLEMKIHDLFPEFKFAMSLLRKSTKFAKLSNDRVPAKGSHTSGNPSHSKFTRKSIRRYIEKLLITKRLEKLKMVKTSLSDEKTLKKQQESLGNVLNEIFTDYRNKNDDK
jgi:succinoglycan biosynthesis protein ExoV